MKSRRYNEIDEAFVHDLNRINQEILDKRFAGGRRIQEYVDSKGGVQYADRTIGNITRHPDFTLHPATVYRWWHYYQVMELLGDELKATCPNIKASHVYELARLLKQSTSFSEGESIEDEQRLHLLLWAEWLQDKMTNGHITAKKFSGLIGEALKNNDHTPPPKAEIPGVNQENSVPLGMRGNSKDDTSAASQATSNGPLEEEGVDWLINIAQKWPKLAEQVLAKSIDDSLVRAVEDLRSQCEEILNGVGASTSAKDFRAARKLEEV